MTPWFDRAVPGGKEAVDGHFNSVAGHFINRAATDQWSLDQEGRLDDLGKLVIGPFEADIFDTDATIAETENRNDSINKSNIDPRHKPALRAKNSANATVQLLRSADAGQVIDSAVIDNELFDPQQKRMMEQANAHLAPAALSLTDSNRTLDSAILAATESRNPAALESDAVAAAVAAISAKGTDSEAQASPAARVLLAKQQISIERGFMEMPAPGAKGPKPYETLMAIQSHWNNPAQREEMRKQFQVPGIRTEHFTQFMDHVRATADKVGKLIETNRGNELFAMSEAGSVIDQKATESFNAGKIDSADIRTYIATSRDYQSAMGVPSEHQNLVPTGIITALLGRFAAGDTDNAHKTLANLGTVFHSDGIFSTARYLISPSGVSELEKGQALGSMKNLAPALGGAVFLAGMDQKGVDVGDKPALSLTPALKTIFDKLQSHAKNSASYQAGASQMSMRAFSTTSFKFPLTLAKFEHMDQIVPDSDELTSFAGITDAVAALEGPDMANGIKALVRNYVEEDSNLPTATGEPNINMLGARMARSANGLLNLIVGTVTVVPGGSDMNTVPHPTLIPNTMSQEGPLEKPGKGGAGNTSDFGYQINSTFQNQLLWTPRKTWDREALSNVWTDVKSSLRSSSLMGEFFSGGADSVLALYSDLVINAADIVDISPNQYGTGNEDAVQKYLQAPKNRATFNGVALAEHGFFRYNHATDNYDLYIEPGRISPKGAASLGGMAAPQPVKYKNGSTVSFPRKRVQEFTDAYRLKRYPVMRDTGPVGLQFTPEEQKQADDLKAWLDALPAALGGKN